nr:type I phosphomannose isomerase catalytic subunit [Armatimonas sp.]
MNTTALYPLRFMPIYQYRLWGGRRLANLLSTPLPADIPIGEAWLLSDREDHVSVVADGSRKGQTIRQLLEESPERMLGKWADSFERFPLLLKFLDAREMLSVQVHPSDSQTNYLPAGEQGKTEAWVVLKAGVGSRIYAGLKPGTTSDTLRQALTNRVLEDQLASFIPQSGDCVFLPAGTVHALGNDTVVFEVQENSDITFRLYDWDRVDHKTGQPRALQVEEALACIDFTQGSVVPVVPEVLREQPTQCERLLSCPHFRLWRYQGEVPFVVGAEGEPRVLVCLAGTGELEQAGTTYPVTQGDVFLLPAVIGACVYRPHGVVSVLEVALPG